MADWNQIKADYISGGISYKGLCDKYGVPFRRLREIGKREKWVELREKACHDAGINLAKAIAKDNSKHTVKLYAVADKLLDKIADTLDNIDAIDSQSIKHYTSALKDLKDIKGIKDDIDLREQEARIEKLRKDAMVDTGDKVITVTFEGDLDKYAD